MGKLTDKIKSSDESSFKTNFYKGLTAFLVISASIIFFFIMLRISDIFSFLEKLWDILLPITYGFVIAYLLNPIMNILEKHFISLFSKCIKNEKRCFMLSRGLAIFISITFALLSVGFLIGAVIPELASSVTKLVTDLPDQWTSFTQRAEQIFSRNQRMSQLYEAAVSTAGEYITNWVNSDLSSNLNTGISFLANGIVGIVGFITDFIIGIVVAVYVMAGKERFCAQSKKLLYSFFSPDKTNRFIDSIRQSHKIFGGFITGKIIDSIIVGILCFICLTIMNMPYTVLVSVIVGVTNIIPFFGPYIGAIPSAFLILLADPWKGIYFIIFIIILQQIDGNLIGPAILGPSTGLSEFWVMFSLLLGGGLFGVVGMIIGTPAFAVFYFLFRNYINDRLKDRNMPVSSDEYKNKDKLMYSYEDEGYRVTDMVVPNKTSTIHKIKNIAVDKTSKYRSDKDSKDN